MSTPKLVNFPHSGIPEVETKHVYIYNMYICTYVYYMILLYLDGSGSKFHSVRTKTSQFSPFLDSRSWEKTCVYIICIYVHMYICTYVYVYICIYVHMYITWFCYIWRVVVLSFIPSTPKLVNFLPFLDSRSWGKNMSTPKLANFPFFGFQELRKNMRIYMCVCICQLFPTISPHFMGSSIANGNSFSSYNTSGCTQCNAFPPNICFVFYFSSRFL